MAVLVWAAENYVFMKTAAVLYLTAVALLIHLTYKQRKYGMSHKCGKCGVKFNSEKQAVCGRCKPKEVPVAPPMPTLRKPTDESSTRSTTNLKE